MYKSQQRQHVLKVAAEAQQATTTSEEDLCVCVYFKAFNTDSGQNCADIVRSNGGAAEEPAGSGRSTHVKVEPQDGNK